MSTKLLERTTIHGPGDGGSERLDFLGKAFAIGKRFNETRYHMSPVR